MQRDERCKYGCGFMREPKFMAAVSGRCASLHISGSIHHAINPLTSSLPSSPSAATRCSAMLLRFHTHWHLNERIHECTSLTPKRPAEECAFKPAVNSPWPTLCCQGWPCFCSQQKSKHFTFKVFQMFSFFFLKKESYYTHFHLFFTPDPCREFSHD